MTLGCGAHLDRGPALCFPVRPMEPGASSPESPPVPGAESAPAAVPAAARASAVSRFAEWFWGGRKMAELRQQAAREDRGVETLFQRARLSAEVAARALKPGDSFLKGRADALACELYRQSIHWSLKAQAAARGEEPSPSGLEASGLAELASGVDADLPRTFADFSMLSPAEQAESVRRLGSTANALLGSAATTSREIDRVWLKRSVRMGICAFVVVTGLAGWWALRGRMEESQDLALGRPWRASSEFGGAGCRSPSQVCSDSPDYFFHTQEEERPWLEIDLGAPRNVAAVRVVNRKDCCRERATPLAVEVATAPNRFREVARFVEPITDRTLEFEPVPARYVRVRAVDKTLLHLSRVRVFGK
jgi:hypothetical protein